VLPERTLSVIHAYFRSTVYEFLRKPYRYTAYNSNEWIVRIERQHHG